MSPEESSATPPPRPPHDSIWRGIGWAVLWQIAAIVVTIPIFTVGWGLVQWFALIPVYLRQRRKGRRLAAKGVLITGFLGLLLNATCAALILWNPRFIRTGMRLPRYQIVTRAVTTAPYWPG